MMSMVSPAAINADGSLSGAVGSGPYKLTKWDRNVEYVFEANDDCWGGKPNPRKITFKVITDAQARASALESGEIDVLYWPGRKTPRAGMGYASFGRQGLYAGKSADDYPGDWMYHAVGGLFSVFG
jgi:ABC-type transport system substrate-binding protein